MVGSNPTPATKELVRHRPKSVPFRLIGYNLMSLDLGKSKPLLSSISAEFSPEKKCLYKGQRYVCIHCLN